MSHPNRKKWPKPTERTPHQCEWCGKLFAKEATLISHPCNYRDRWTHRDDRRVKLAFWSYQRFYQISGVARGKKEKTYEDFMYSPYYAAFVRYAGQSLKNEIIDVRKYTDWLIKKGIQLDRWPNDEIYKEYIREYCKEEPMERAISRNIELMNQWARDTGEKWSDFFRKVETPLATLWIKSGRLSPWLLFTVDSAKELFVRLTEEQASIVTEYANPVFWQRKLSLRKEEVKAIRETFAEQGL